MNRRYAILSLFVCLAVSSLAHAQDPVGAIEGLITEKSGSPVVAARVAAKNLDNGFSEHMTEANGLFRIPLLPIGQYSIAVNATNFATIVEQPIAVNVSETVRVELELAIAAVKSTVTVTAEAPLADTSTNTLGAVVTGREILELPLNGRNFTQLGLLQNGAAPLTGGLIEAGGPLREGETYAVNGARPEQNMYMVDGAENVNRMDGGYALKIPVVRSQNPHSHPDRAPRIWRNRGRRPRRWLHAPERTTCMARSTSSYATIRWTRAISSRPM